MYSVRRFEEREGAAALSCRLSVVGCQNFATVQFDVTPMRSGQSAPSCYRANDFGQLTTAHQSSSGGPKRFLGCGGGGGLTDGRDPEGGGTGRGAGLGAGFGAGFGVGLAAGLFSDFAG